MDHARQMSLALRLARAVMAAALSLGVVATAGCGARSADLPPEPQARGHLVIAGGGLNSRSDAVYRTILDLAGPTATVGVIPTASGEPEDSGERTLNRILAFRDYEAGEVIDLTVENAEKAMTHEMAARIAAHDSIFFTGGQQRRVLQTFHPDGEPTPSAEVLWEILARDGVLSGSSAGAALMSNPMIRRGNSAASLDEGMDCSRGTSAVCTMEGFGFFPYGLVDQHFQTRGRLGRLVVAMHAHGIPFGFGVDDNCAMVVSLGTGEITLIGNQAMMFVDMTNSTVDDSGYYNIRLALLGEGDSMNARTGRIEIAGHRSVSRDSWDDDTSAPEFENAWDRHVFNEALNWMGATGTPSKTIPAGDWEVRLTIDSSTRFYRADDPAETSVEGLWMDIVRVEP